MKPIRTDNIHNVLGVIQLSDSFFPTGMYTMSSGLEHLLSKRKINQKELQELIAVYIEGQLGPLDCTALGSSYGFAKESDIEKILEADNIIFSMRLVKETRDASTRSGTQMVRCVNSFAKSKILKSYQGAIEEKKATGIYPVAFGVAASALGISKLDACMMMLYSFCTSIAGAALRMGIIDHFGAQKIIHNSKPVISLAAEKNIDMPFSNIWQFAPEIDLMQISHEQMDSKMFIT